MDEGELIQAAAAFATQPIPKGNRVGLITNTGGPAVIATDILVGAGLEIPPLSGKTEKALKETLYSEASVNNPVDVLATGTAAHYRACMDAMNADENYDALYINFVTPFFVDTDSIAREIAEVNRLALKPMVCNLMTDKRQWTETVRILQEGGVPSFSLPGEAARAMTALVRYNDIRSRKIGTPDVFDDVDKNAGLAIIDKAAASGADFLPAEDVYRILDAYNIPTADWRVAESLESAVKAAGEIGYPVVVKADAASVVHKSDAGGVAVNLPDDQAVQTAVQDMQKQLDAPDLKFFVQKYHPGGMEVILGAKAEPGLGHLIMFGMGGIYVEILKDVVFNLTPVTRFEAEEMLDTIRLAPLLKGVRGQQGVQRSGIVETIQRLSLLVSDLSAIQELDLNPTLAFEDRVVVVDARIGL
jgi:acetyltransferase